MDGVRGVAKDARHHAAVHRHRFAKSLGILDRRYQDVCKPDTAHAGVFFHERQNGVGNELAILEPLQVVERSGQRGPIKQHRAVAMLGHGVQHLQKRAFGRLQAHVSSGLDPQQAGLDGDHNVHVHQTPPKDAHSVVQHRA